MAEISIIQEHQLSPDMARVAAQKVADRMAAEYGLACRWDGDALCFACTGVEGSLTLGDQRAALRIRLGFLMDAFASIIQAKLADNMRKAFGTA